MDNTADILVLVLVDILVLVGNILLVCSKRLDYNKDMDNMV